MTTKTFRGLFTALITPFTADNKIDYEALTNLLKEQESANVDGAVILGTTGENPTISDIEFRDIISHSVESTKNNFKIIVGTGTNNTESTINKSRVATELGADGLLVVSPYYNKPTQEGLYQHFSAVADSTPTPILIYNIQGRTGVNISTDTLVKLSKQPNIVGVKESSGDITQVMDVIAHTDDSFAVISGDDPLTYPIMSLGGVGSISVLSNVMPKEMYNMVNLLLDKNYDASKKLHYKLLPYMNALMSYGTNPMGAKTILALQNKIQNQFRLPLCPLNDIDKKSLGKAWGI